MKEKTALRGWVVILLIVVIFIIATHFVVLPYLITTAP